MERVGDGAGQAGDGEHAEQDEQPVHEVVGVEARGVEREAGPRPPDREEEGEIASEASRGGIGAQGERDLCDRTDEDEVEKELEPGRAPILVLLPRAESRRLEETREPAQRPLNSGFRFSVKAVRPSFASSLANAR
jgi:hypothetical protein